MCALREHPTKMGFRVVIGLQYVIPSEPLTDTSKTGARTSPPDEQIARVLGQSAHGFRQLMVRRWIMRRARCQSPRGRRFGVPLLRKVRRGSFSLDGR
jgi:hypothetical protein